VLLVSFVFFVSCIVFEVGILSLGCIGRLLICFVSISFVDVFCLGLNVTIFLLPGLFSSNFLVLELIRSLSLLLLSFIVLVDFVDGIISLVG